MPTYEYECAKCHKDFEIFQSMKDDSFTTCPKERCRMKSWGKGRVKRKLGVGAGFIFKGSGFYITDYRSEGYKSGAKSESTAKSDAAKPAESSSTAAPKADAPKSEPAKTPKAAPKKE